MKTKQILTLSFVIFMTLFIKFNTSSFVDASNIFVEPMNEWEIEEWNKMLVLQQEETYYEDNVSHETIQYSKNFCGAIVRWERPDATNGNYHGVMVDDKVVNFPWTNSKGVVFNDSYEWCNATYDWVDEKNVRHVVCEIYKSDNTCDNIEQFKTEVENYE